MRRSISFLLVGAVAAFAVACRDSAVAPASSSDDLSSASNAANARGRGTISTVVGTIEISPNGGVYRVGDFEVVIPAGAVCDPATTRYGRQYWDQDCASISRSITVNVVSERRRDRASVDFQPDLRFRPSAGAVIVRTDAYRSLLTSDGVRELSPDASGFRALGMLYSRGSSRVDEVLLNRDRSLITHIDRSTGMVWRRVKHFSGYLISLGFTCAATTDDGGGCTGSEDSGLPDAKSLSAGDPAELLVDPMSVIVDF